MIERRVERETSAVSRKGTIRAGLSAAALAMVLAGCSGADPQQGVLPLEGYLFRRDAPRTSRTVFSKNYQVGDRYTSKVAEPMISVKNYDVYERVARAIALQDFVQSCAKGRPCDDEPLSLVRGNLGDSFSVAGSVPHNGVDYYMVAMEPVAMDENEPKQASGSAFVLADATGKLRDPGYVAWRQSGEKRRSPKGLPHEQVVPEHPLDIAGPVFAFETDESFVPGGPQYLNYDVVYGGIEQGSRGPLYRIFYREYRRDRADLPSFEQGLAFPVGQSSFDLLGHRITVHAVTENTIDFTVDEDTYGGLSE